MPDLVAVQDELRSRLSRYAAGLRESANLTDANAAASRKEDAPDDDTYVLLGAQPYAERGMLLPH